jgi:hypothetical protein
VIDIVTASTKINDGIAMTAMPELRNTRPITEEAFRAFLSWLSKDESAAAREYLSIRKSLVGFFVRKGCAHSEELADRTLDRVIVIAHADPSKYSKPMALCWGVARNVWLEYLREAAPEALEIDRFAAPETRNNEFTDCEIECLEGCLRKLSPHDRDLITRYHQFNGARKIEARKVLAEELGGLNKLRITAFRIRTRLHNCVSGCVQQSNQF